MAHKVQQAYASLGYVAVAVDARYHGDRGRSAHAYGDVSARTNELH